MFAREFALFTICNVGALMGQAHSSTNCYTSDKLRIVLGTVLRRSGVIIAQLTQTLWQIALTRYLV